MSREGEKTVLVKDLGEKSKTAPIALLLYFVTP